MERCLDEQLFLARYDCLFPSGADLRDIADGMHGAYAEYLGNVVCPRKATLLLRSLRLEKLVIGTKDCPRVQGCCRIIGKGVRAFSDEYLPVVPKDSEIRGDGPVGWRESLTAART